MADDTQHDPAELPFDAAPSPAPAPAATEADGKPDEFEDEEPEFGYEIGTAEFYNIVHKQVIHVTTETLAAAKLDWEVVEPFLNAARDVCRGDFVRTARIEVHGVAGDTGALEEAEEAYLSLSVADQDTGAEWYAETWWLSDLVLQTGDPARVREAVDALERTTARLRQWLDSADRSEGEAATDRA